MIQVACTVPKRAYRTPGIQTHGTLSEVAGAQGTAHLSDRSFFEHLGLFVLPNFLEAEFIVSLRTQMLASRSEHAIVVGIDGATNVDEKVRRAQYIAISKETISALHDRFIGLIPELGKHFGVKLVGCDNPQCLMYRVGDFFTRHSDGGYSSSTNETRRLAVSAVVFLNEESLDPAPAKFGEGRLILHGLLRGPLWDKCRFGIDAEAGLLVAFPSERLHEVTPVSHGERFTVVTWYYAGKDESESVTAQT